MAHLADGTYTAQATQEDEAGNVGKSAAVTFTIDTTPPVVAITTPANNAGLNELKPTFSGPAGELPGDEPTVELKIYLGETAAGTPAETIEVPVKGGHWAVSPVSR